MYVSFPTMKCLVIPLGYDGGDIAEKMNNPLMFMIATFITRMNHQKAFYCLNSQFLLTYQCIDGKQ